jgi:hypothetical protein
MKIFRINREALDKALYRARKKYGKCRLNAKPRTSTIHIDDSLIPF